MGDAAVRKGGIGTAIPNRATAHPMDSPHGVPSGLPDSALARVYYRDIFALLSGRTVSGDTVSNALQRTRPSDQHEHRFFWRARSGQGNTG